MTNALTNTERKTHDLDGHEEIYLPTPEEIAEQTAEIRKGWATKHHNDYKPPAYERPVVSTDGLSSPAWPAEPLYPMDE